MACSVDVCHFKRAQMRLDVDYEWTSGNAGLILLQYNPHASFVLDSFTCGLVLAPLRAMAALSYRTVYIYPVKVDNRALSSCEGVGEVRTNERAKRPWTFAVASITRHRMGEGVIPGWIGVIWPYAGSSHLPFRAEGYAHVRNCPSGLGTRVLNHSCTTASGGWKSCTAIAPRYVQRSWTF